MIKTVKVAAAAAHVDPLAVVLYPPNAVILAPLSGYTDEPFRRACRRYGLRYAFAPMVDARSLVCRPQRNQRALFRAPDEPWLGVQLIGNAPDSMAGAASLLNRYHFDVLDLNMGCPVPKVVRKGAGAALSGNPELAARCVEACREASRVPVTAKIRIADEEDVEATLGLARQLERAGIQALTIHGRHVNRIYSGRVATEIIAAVRDAVGIPVVANGGVMDDESARLLRRQSRCTRIMVARGAIGNPWIFSGLTGIEARAPTHQELCSQVETQVAGMVRLYGEDVGMRNARKIILAYLKGRGYRRQRRAAVTQLETMVAFRRFMDSIRREGPSFTYMRQNAASSSAVRGRKEMRVAAREEGRRGGE